MGQSQESPGLSGPLTVRKKLFRRNFRELWKNKTKKKKKLRTLTVTRQIGLLVDEGVGRRNRTVPTGGRRNYRQQQQLERSQPHRRGVESRTGYDKYYRIKSLKKRTSRQQQIVNRSRAVIRLFILSRIGRSYTGRQRRRRGAPRESPPEHWRQTTANVTRAYATEPSDGGHPVVALRRRKTLPPPRRDTARGVNSFSTRYYHIVIYSYLFL